MIEYVTADGADVVRSTVGAVVDRLAA